MLSGEEVFLQRQVLKLGHSCFYEPDMSIRHLVPASRLHKPWFRRRCFWQGVSDAVMELISDNPSPLARGRRGLFRAWRLLARPRALVEIFLPTEDPDRFQARCFKIIEIGYMAGMLGLARR